MMKNRSLIIYGVALFVSAACASGSLAQTDANPFSRPPQVQLAAPFSRPTVMPVPGYRYDAEMVKAIHASNQTIADAIKAIKDAETDDAKAEFKSEIKTQLEIQYDSYLAQHEKPLKQLEERLATLRAEFESRKQAKGDLVKLRLDTIWYNALGIGWPGGSGGPNYQDILARSPSLLLNVPGRSFPSNLAPVPSGGIYPGVPVPPNLPLQRGQIPFSNFAPTTPPVQPHSNSPAVQPQPASPPVPGLKRPAQPTPTPKPADPK